MKNLALIGLCILLLSGVVTGKPAAMEEGRLSIDVVPGEYNILYLPFYDHGETISAVGRDIVTSFGRDTFVAEFDGAIIFC